MPPWLMRRSSRSTACAQAGWPRRKRICHRKRRRRVGEFRRAARPPSSGPSRARGRAPPSPRSPRPAAAPAPPRPCGRARRAARDVLHHLAVLRPVGGGDPLQDLAEGGAAVARLRREVGAAPEGLASRRQEHGQRPAAPFAEQVQRVHVQGVDVRALFPVHLDVHEVRVHQRRRVRVLEGLVRHDVAPVAGGVADGEQDGLAGGPGLGQCFRPPLAPMHRVLGVLEQVGRGSAGQQVFRREAGVVGHGRNPGRGRARPLDGWRGGALHRSRRRCTTRRAPAPERTP
jgi:hypothetical protein